MRLDRDPALAFEVHRIEQLILLIALVDRAGAVEQSIRKRRLAVIDMRDDAEIPGQLDRHKAQHYAGASSVGQSGGRLNVGVIPSRADGEGRRKCQALPRYISRSPRAGVTAS